MIIVDANILIYAFIEDFPQHDRARAWLDQQLAQQPRVGLPWTSLLTFVRLVSNPRLLVPAVPIGDAFAQVRRWLTAKSAWCPQATARHAEVVERYLRMPGLRADDIPDAHLAGLAIEHGLTLATNDRGFARFDGLAVMNPLAED
jgi:uncharacterized protein